MSIVELNHLKISQLMQFTPCQMMAAQNVSYGASALEVLLHQAQLFTRGVVVVRVQHFGEFFSVDALLLCAQDLGYGGCWIGSNGNATAERVGKVLRLPAGWKIYALFSVGVPAEEAHREKKRLEEIVSYNGF